MTRCKKDPACKSDDRAKVSPRAKESPCKSDAVQKSPLVQRCLCAKVTRSLIGYLDFQKQLNQIYLYKTTNVFILL